ncbi:MAG: GGDEF domain-containing protein [Actinomycetota bacterium]
MDLALNETERTRLREIATSFGSKLVIAYVATAAVLVAAVPTYGWWVVAVVGGDAVRAAAFQSIGLRGPRPEAWYLADLILSSATVAIGVWFTGGVESPFFPWFAMVAAVAPTLFVGKLLAIASAALTLSVIVAAFGPSSSTSAPAWLAAAALLAAMLTVLLSFLELLSFEGRFRRESAMDPLTGLPNRRSFDRRMAVLAEDDVAPISLLLIDIDHFKRINDEFGHDRGDEVLADVAAELQAALRGDDRPFRIGGEEFVFVLPHTPPQRAAELAEVVRHRLDVAAVAALPVTVSVGVATAADGRSLDAALHAADDALRRAKAAGRNRVVAAS